MDVIIYPEAYLILLRKKNFQSTNRLRGWFIHLVYITNRLCSIFSQFSFNNFLSFQANPLGRIGGCLKTNTQQL